MKLPNVVVRYMMAFLKCKYLRRSVMLAGAILIAGMFLEVFTHLMPVSNLPILQFVALAVVMSSPVIILIVMVLSFFPLKSLKDCTQ